MVDFTHDYDADYWVLLQHDKRMGQCVVTREGLLRLAQHVPQMHRSMLADYSSDHELRVQCSAVISEALAAVLADPSCQEEEEEEEDAVVQLIMTALMVLAIDDIDNETTQLADLPSGAGLRIWVSPADGVRVFVLPNHVVEGLVALHGAWLAGGSPRVH